MRTNTEIKIQGVKALIHSLGIVEAEKFIALIQQEPFDYTIWQRGLMTDKTALEISKEASDFLILKQMKIME
ncbi:MAG: hypothetical protein HQK79_05310 [Desulfobacterales bacterium]|nr:hypothetical protein [Desulfobacterales bacterium]MBF0398331.1 hypothetical protein [Desulfobacterales bacterium]